MMNFIRTTILGGILFLLPLVVVVAVVDKALGMVHIVATPLLSHLPADNAAGLALIHLLSIFLLVLVCFLAGIAAQLPAAGALVKALESDILMKFPPYALFKAKTGSVLNPQERDKLAPVLIRFDDSWQLGYQVESVDANRRLIFLPGSPDAWSGSVCLVDSDRVTFLDVPVKEVTAAMKCLGKGAGQIVSKPIDGQVFA